jgi:uncharacterized membrane protein YbhN (UPF0104 family)
LRRRLATAVLLLALMAALLLAVPGLRGILDEVGHMSAGWVAAAIALEVASCASFGVIFRLFFDRIAPVPAHELAWTEMASGALLPGGGVGGLAVGGWLMRLAGMPSRRIVQRSTGLFFLTSTTNIAVVIGGGLLLATGLSAGPGDWVDWALPIAGAAIATAVVAAIPRLAGGVAARARWVRALTDGIKDAERALRSPSWRLLGAIGYLGFDIAVLWATLRGVGYTIAIAPLLLGYSIGQMANMLPIPAGVGVLDAGLTGALVLYGAPATQAAAAVLVYHAIAFSVPGLGGLIAYIGLRRRLIQPMETGAETPPAPLEAHG